MIRREKMGWEEISLQAAKIVSFSGKTRASIPEYSSISFFLDLAGHERYLKTTLYGLTSGAPSCVILMVGANAGLIGMSKEHLAIALALSVPVVVCITKVFNFFFFRRSFSMLESQIDMTPPNVLSETVKQAVKILQSPGCRYVRTAQLFFFVGLKDFKENSSFRQVSGDGRGDSDFLWV